MKKNKSEFLNELKELRKKVTCIEDQCRECRTISKNKDVLNYEKPIF